MSTRGGVVGNVMEREAVEAFQAGEWPVLCCALENNPVGFWED